MYILINKLLKKLCKLNIINLKNFNKLTFKIMFKNKTKNENKFTNKNEIKFPKI